MKNDKQKPGQSAKAGRVRRLVRWVVFRATLPTKNPGTICPYRRGGEWSDGYNQGFKDRDMMEPKERRIKK